MGIVLKYFLLLLYVPVLFFTYSIGVKGEESLPITLTSGRSFFNTGFEQMPLWNFLDNQAITIKKNNTAAGVPLPPTPKPVAVPIRETAQNPPPVVNVPTPGVNPFLGSTFYVDQNAKVKLWANEHAVSRLTDAKLMQKIASQPVAAWFGFWTQDIKKEVENLTGAITSSGALPVFVAYNLPHLDCNYATGAKSASAYKAWIDGFATGIGSRKAVVFLEPDALGHMDCLSPADKTERMNLIKYAVLAFKKQGNVFTYIDAGNPKWTGQQVMAERLFQSGIKDASGFALNIANFFTTADNIEYGKKLSSMLDGAHFVIDTSRNGTGPISDTEWCNPKGRAVGNAPTTNTGNSLVDAYFWIKNPTESDGTCNGGPSAGTFWPEYALDLAKNASW